MNRSQVVWPVVVAVVALAGLGSGTPVDLSGDHDHREQCGRDQRRPDHLFGGFVVYRCGIFMHGVRSVICTVLSVPAVVSVVPSARAAGRVLEVGVAVSVKVAVAGARDVEVALWAWLRGVGELRGRVQRDSVMPGPGEQGPSSGDLEVALASTGAATALVTSLQVWLTNRHTDVTVSVTVPDGRQVTVNATRAQDMTQVRDLLNAALASDGDSPPGRPAGGVAGDESGDGQPPAPR